MNKSAEPDQFVPGSTLIVILSDPFGNLLHRKNQTIRFKEELR